MRRLLIVAGTLAALAAPAGTASAHGPSKADKREAKQECRAERGETAASREAFREKYGTNHNGRNAFGKCVSQKARENKAERKAARRNAAQECREERGETAATRKAFRDKYAAQRHGRNAFGKCVSRKVKEDAGS